MKKMNMRKLLENKGELLKLTTLAFTLVELLAVIVILAIVLIIAVPGMISIINKTKISTYEKQKEMIIEAAKNYVVGENVITSSSNTKFTLSLDNLQKAGYLDKKIINPRDKSVIDCADVFVKRANGKTSYDIDMTCERKNYAIDFASNRIPIVFDGTNWVKADVTNVGNSWFNYDVQQWANVATVFPEYLEKYLDATIGTVIPMTDINGMFVWIPRFRYKLWNITGSTGIDGNTNLVGDHMIDVELETTKTKKSTGTQNGQWLTHPAFTFGDENLSGFWVAKFELGLKDETPEEDIKNGILFKPNELSLIEQTAKSLYEIISSMKQKDNVFNLTEIDDPRMMRNMEWGAMTYLAYSKYGKIGNSKYSGDDRQVLVNNYKNHVTGCGANNQEESWTETCNTYDTETGQGASTTGNITGVYDTAGGAWDVVTGVMIDETRNNIVLGGSGFSQEQLNVLALSSHYYDRYDYGTDPFDISRGHLGDATIEMGKGITDSKTDWWQDQKSFLTPDRPFFLRGSSAWKYGGLSGPTAYYLWTGNLGDIAARVVMF